MKTYLIGKFWHPEHVTDALSKMRDIGVKAKDVFSPFPLTEIEPLLDIKRTRLSITAFIYGALGALTAVTMITLIYGAIWPMNIGGKPSLPIPDYVPITFELTILFAAHGTILTFLVVSSYWPGKKAILMDERQTDDVFVIAIEKDSMPTGSEADATRIMTDAGAYVVTEKEV